MEEYWNAGQIVADMKIDRHVNVTDFVTQADVAGAGFPWCQEADGT
jgi:hypothetical protein